MQSRPMVKKNGAFGAVLTAVVAIVLSATLARPALAYVSPGLYSLSGNDPVRGPFTTLLEVRQDGMGGIGVSRLTGFQNFTFHGRSVSTAWTGRGSSQGGGCLSVAFSLIRADFIASVEGVTRDEEDRAPLPVVGTLCLSGATLEAVYEIQEASGRTDFPVSESGPWLADPPAEPIFEPLRRLIATHPPLDPGAHGFFFAIFKSFHDTPWVVPYAGRPEFQAAVHYTIDDKTDLAYYRANPGNLRVVNKVLDPVSLAETEVRATAFGPRLHEKAAVFDAGTATFIDPTGMLAKKKTGPPPTQYEADGDGALWTGMYIASQAFRYRVTGAAEALDNIRGPARALLTLIDIPQDPTIFARTLRLHEDPIEGNWRQGTGEFAGLDWLCCGNNDMFKGVVYGPLMAYDSLDPSDPEDAALRSEIGEHLARFARSHPIANDGQTNDLMVHWAGAYMTGAADLRQRTRALQGSPFLLIEHGVGIGPMYYQGISDWSGNHLAIASHAPLVHLAERENPALLSLYSNGIRGYWLPLRPMQLPILAMARYAWGPEGPPGEWASIEEARFGLASFPMPKNPYPVDHSISDSFCLSPYPALPWKFDWTTNPGRAQGIVSYPLFERGASNYAWKDNVLGFAGGDPEGTVPAADYLYAYWLGRAYGVIAADE